MESTEIMKPPWFSDKKYLNLLKMSKEKRASKKPTWRKVAVYLSGFLLVAHADPRPTSFLVGCVLVTLAWVVRIWAFGHLEKNQVMVTTGPYAHTRNPAYFGSFLALLGFVIAAGNFESTRGLFIWAFSLVLILAFFLFYFPRKMAREYPRIEKLFGEQVHRHAANVPDFWPQIKPWRSGDDREFSWARVGSNHEWDWGFVLGLLMAAVWFVESWSPFLG
jgi:protein-S-isoprenylcysteine O-methyltransferase Ste14